MINRSSQRCVIGCDVGTQSTKAVLLAESGEVIATRGAPHAVSFPAAGWAEQDPRDWIAATETVLQGLVGVAPGPISHIGVSAQVDGVVPLDADRRPLHAAVIWMDRRAIAEALAVEERLGSDAIYAVTGLNCDAGHAAPKMRWLLDRLEERPRHLVAPATLVTGWLCGSLAQDHANASSSLLYDVTARAWSDRMLAAFEIDDGLLPPIVEATEEIGAVAAHVADRLGLVATCRVIAGTGDDHAGAVGAGAVRPGIVVDIAGTAEPIGTTAAAPVFDSERLVEAHAHAVPRVSFIENAGFVSGGSILWLSRLLGIDQAAVFERAAAAAPGAGGLTFVPALSGSMTPRWNASARGSFTGLTMEHGPAEVCRAVVEGCVYAAKDVIDRLAALGLPIDEVRVTGGGAVNELWLQIKADATGRPTRFAEHHASPVGAACLAAVAAGWFVDLEAASASAVRMSPRVFQPNPATEAAYADGYRRYRQAFDALEPTFDQGAPPR